MKSKKPLIYIAGLIVIITAGAYFYYASSATIVVTDKDLITVPRVDYPQVVLCQGFLEAKSSVQVSAPLVTDTPAGGGRGGGGGPQGGGAAAVVMMAAGGGGGGGQGGVGNQFKLVRMVDEGTQVAEGDFLLEFDGTSFASQLREAQSSYQSYQEQTQQQRSRRDSSRRQSQLDLDQARSDLGVLEQKINQQAELESAITIAITKIQRDMKQSQLALLEKQIKYQEEKDRIDMQIRRNNENRTKMRLELLLDTMDSLTVRAPVSGIVIYKRDQLNQLPQLGSNWSPMNWILQIPDLSTMRVKVSVDEPDVGKVRVDQKVRVTVPALQGLALDAKVIEMSSILTTASFDRAQKVATARVELEPGQDLSMLRPGMSVNVQVQVGIINQALAIPMSCIQERNGGSYVQVYKADKKNFEWREIELQTNDENLAVIKSGLTEKERIRSKPKV
jgi:HlyD family secretion protein